MDAVEYVFENDIGDGFNARPAASFQIEDAELIEANDSGRRSTAPTERNSEAGDSGKLSAAGDGSDDGHIGDVVVGLIGDDQDGPCSSLLAPPGRV
jgi:hypothetical protein